MPEDTEDDRSEASVESFLHKLTSECMCMCHFHNDIINTEWQVKACTKILYQYEYYLISNDHACVRVTCVQTEGNKREKNYRSLSPWVLSLHSDNPPLPF